MTTCLVLHPGEMGAAVGAALTEVGHDVAWIPRGRSQDTQRRAERAGLRVCATPAECQVVISICPPSAALETAQAIGAFPGLYVDANAISPPLARRVAEIVSAAGAHYVDGGVIGPPPHEAGTTRLYLSGDRADQTAALFRGSRLDARVLAGPPFAASALKMAYASWTKISAAVLIAARSAARSMEVEDALIAEWELSQPGLEARSAAAIRAATAKGWRWEEEMRQIAATFAAANQPAEFGAGAADLFARYDRPQHGTVP